MRLPAMSEFCRLHGRHCLLSGGKGKKPVHKRSERMHVRRVSGGKTNGI